MAAGSQATGLGQTINRKLEYSRIRSVIYGYRTPVIHFECGRKAFMRILYFIVFISMACAQGQSRLPTQAEMETIKKDYQTVLQQALNSKIIREFREVFPTDTIGLSQYRVPLAKHTVFGEVGLSSRYILHFSASLKFDKSWTKIVEFG